MIVDQVHVSHVYLGVSNVLLTGVGSVLTGIICIMGHVLHNVLLAVTN